MDTFNKGKIIITYNRGISMFKKIASDALGLSDIGVVVPKSDFDKTDSDDFIFTEKGEEIYFLIKTKADEYCFTNLALIHVDGTNALSKKRMLRRYDYEYNTISDVMLETAGTIDLDVEIKFSMNNETFSIDIHKKFLTAIKDLYKALHAISLEQKSNSFKLQSANEGIQLAAQSLHRNSIGEASPSQTFEEITKFSFNWLAENKQQFMKKDFGDTFELYINN